MHFSLKNSIFSSFYLVGISILISFFVIQGCLSDELVSLNKKSPISKSNWDDREKLFFNVNNSSQILTGKLALSNRGDYMPDILLSVYNQMVEDNEVDSFVYSVSRRIGFPLWTESIFEISEDSTTHIVYVPFVMPENNSVSGYLMGYKDYDAISPELITSVTLRNTLDSIQIGRDQPNTNTCHELIRMLSFDRYIFNSVSSEELDEAYCESCFDLTPTTPTISSFCDTLSFEICYKVDIGQIDDVEFQDYGWTVTTNPGTYGGGGNGPIVFGGIYNNDLGNSFPDGTNPNQGSEVDWGALFEDVQEWVNSAVDWLEEAVANGGGAIGDFFGWLAGLFGPKVKCPNNFFTGGDTIDNRSEEYICAPYVMVTCYNGSWWEVVATIPCDGCDIGLEIEKQNEAACKIHADSFIVEYDIPFAFQKQGIGASLLCCEEGKPDYNCALEKYYDLVSGCAEIEFEGRKAHLIEFPEDINWAKDFIEDNGCSPKTARFVETVLDLRKSDSAIRTDRCTEFFDLLEADPNFLISDCFTSQTPNYEFWSALASYNPPQSVHDRIESLGEGWFLQTLITPTLAPSINLDYFAVNISEMPIMNPLTGERWAVEDLYIHIRKNLNQFINTQLYAEFIGYGMPNNTYDFDLWQSNNPLGAVLSILIPGDDGSVIFSKYENNCWIFSTLTAPLLPFHEDGTHPVSGNRQFGFVQNPNSSVDFYIKGVDRYFFPNIPLNGGSYKLLAYLSERLFFTAADGLWQSFQNKLVTFVNNNGGSASVIPYTSKRPLTQNALSTLLSGNTSLLNINLCDN